MFAFSKYKNKQINGTIFKNFFMLFKSLHQHKASVRLLMNFTEFTDNF